MKTKDIKQLIQKKYGTFNKFCEALGVDRVVVSNILRRRSSNITAINALKIKQATGLEFWDFLDGLDAIKKLKK